MASALAAPSLFNIASTLAIGSRIRTRATGITGTVRFLGEVGELPAGLWAGIELDTPDGKTDGTAKGTRLFQCAPLHGITMRPKDLNLLEADGATSSNMPGSGPKVVARAASAAALAVKRPAAAAKSSAGDGAFAKPGTKKDLANFETDFVRLVAAATPANIDAASTRGNVVDAKAANAVNGLETSSFTVCARVRPVLRHELGQSESYAVVVPTNAAAKSTSAHNHTEEMSVFTPKVSLMGKPTIVPAPSAFDFAFGEAESNEAVFEAVGRPLVRRALAGQVGVCFAYGQTGSGKTHTINGLMDGLVGQLYEADDRRAISMQYMECLGANLHDCLAPSSVPAPKGGVAIGEGLDGRVIVKNLSSHKAVDATALQRLVAKAQGLRSTAATERNDESSRSHGVAIITIGQPGSLDADASSAAYSPADGTLYVIDLAGSERAADSKGHSKERMDETKQINLSLMALKECIRARTLASAPGAGKTVHVPFRRNKLTMLLKDVFDYSCSRLCATVVIAAVSPLARDAAHSANTLKYAAPLRVAASSSRVKLERDPADPALWDGPQLVEWLQGVCTCADVAPDGYAASLQRSSGFGDASENAAPNVPADPYAAGGGAGASEVAQARARKAAAAAESIAEGAAAEFVVNNKDAAAMRLAGTQLDAAALVGGLTGVQLCGMPESELHRMVLAQVGGAGGAALAKRIHSTLWTAIVDAKTRGRRPDGSLITAEMEAEEREQADRAMVAKMALWREREKGLRGE